MYSSDLTRAHKPTPLIASDAATPVSAAEVAETEAEEVVA